MIDNIIVRVFSFILLVVVILSSCKKENEEHNNNPLKGLTKLKEGYAKGASVKIEIWGEKNFFAGYNKLCVVVYDSLNLTERITDAHIYFEPQMTMAMGATMRIHGAPVENPDELAVDGVFSGAIAFMMPTSSAGVWKLKVRIHTHKHYKTGEAEFDITVDNPVNPLIKSFVSQSADSSKLFVSLVQPEAPKVGVNDIEFTIHSMADMMNFSADDSYTIEITPEMPSMGHGSPNNVNPSNTGKGHYKGKVNFTMTGEWRINVVVKKNGVIVSNGLYFTIVL